MMKRVRTSHLINPIGASLLDREEVVRRLSLKSRASGPRRVLRLDHTDNHRRSLHRIGYARLHRFQLGDHRPPALPVCVQFREIEMKVVKEEEKNH